MTAQKVYDKLPPPRPVNHAKDQLYNRVLDVLRDLDVAFTPVQVSTTGVHIASTLCNTMWYLDPHHDKLLGRAVSLPEAFESCRGFNDWRRHKHKKPVISADDLEQHTSSVADMLNMPWFLNAKFGAFKHEVEKLLEGLVKYAKHLNQQKERTAAAHSSDTPIRSIVEHSSLHCVNASAETGRDYVKLKTHLDQCDTYEPVFMYEYQPTDRYDRRYWLQHLSLPFPVKLYTYHHGNYFGNFNFIWKYDEAEEHQHGDGDLKVINSITKDIPVFSTRTMRTEFIDRYASSLKSKPALLRNVYRYLTDDSSAAESEHQKEVDSRVCNFILGADDPDLFCDLRKNNGRLKDERLDPFWEELGKYLEEVAVVHDRRHEAHMYMPLAISLNNLIDIIAKRLPKDTPCPSVSWLRMNFWPSNSYHRTAVCYTGRFMVRYAVQQRLLRGHHPDSNFAFKQFIMMKQMAVKLRDVSEFLCVDDKSVVPVGEPGQPVATGVRPNKRALAPVGVKVAALDHDFHVHGVVPSVVFHVNIPQNASDSFYDGSIHVTVKDKVFQPSTAMRHATETTSVLRSVASEDGVNTTKPVLFVFSDGGPDHRSTYISVQLSLISLFIVLDLDLLVSARTAPSQSYANPAERCMSLLNMALQHTSLERSKTNDAVEAKIKSLSSLKKIRDKAARDPTVKDGLIESTEPVIANLKMRFSHLKLHGEHVQIHDAASDDEIADITNILDIFKTDDDNPDVHIFSELQTKKDVAKFPKLSGFIEAHCRHRHYSFQVKKCPTGQQCWYCTINPPRMSDEFCRVNWLPDPTLGPSNEFQEFDEVYGTETTDAHRPSLLDKPVSKDVDKDNSQLLVAAKVRTFIICAECGKRRVVYCRHKLNADMVQALDRVQEEFSYTCGSCLFPGGHKYVADLVVRETQTCSSPVEITYYAGVVVKFPAICLYCGDTEVTSDHDVVRNFQAQYATVRPICATCLGKGKEPAVRNALKLGKRKR